MEFVYVVKRYDLFNLEFPHGFCSSSAGKDLSAFLQRIKEKGFFIQRSYTETDSGFKQIIPYSIIATGQKVLLLKRSDQQGESRLHNKLSIGVGGHLNPVDSSEDTLLTGCIREVEEELVIDEEYAPEPIGIINDESNAVGSVHFGIVYLIRLQSGCVKVRETSMMTAEFVELPKLKERMEDPNANFESWSTLILESLEFAHL